MVERESSWWDRESRACKAWDHSASKRHVGWFHTAVLFIGLICLVYWGGSNHLAVEVPVYDGVTLQQLHQENVLLSRKVADYKNLSANLAGRLKEANARLAKYTEEYHVLAHSSLPSQPIILARIKEETRTPEGFHKAVVRNFGRELAAHIKIIGE